MERSWKTHLIWLILPPILAIYLSNPEDLASDGIPTKYTALSLATEGNITLDEFPELLTYGRPYYITYNGKNFISSYPIMPAVFAAPVFFLARLATEESFFSNQITFLAKLSASLYVIFSGIILFYLVGNFLKVHLSLLLTLFYLLGTSSFSTSSQGLWQHSPSQFMVALSLFFLYNHLKNSSPLFPLALSSSLAFLIRPTNIIVFISVFLILFLHRRERTFEFLALSAPLLMGFFLYNYQNFNNILGGYNQVPLLIKLDGEFLKRLAGILVSPSRGLFLFTPPLMLSYLGIFLSFRQKNPLFQLSALIFLGYTLLLSCFHFWYGGWCIGPRLFSDSLPAALILIIPVLEKLKNNKIFIALLIFGLIYSVGVQAMAIKFKLMLWNGCPYNIDYRTERLWDFKDSQLLFPLTSGQIFHPRLKIEPLYPPCGGNMIYPDWSFKYKGPSEVSEYRIYTYLRHENQPRIWISNSESFEMKIEDFTSWQALVSLETIAWKVEGYDSQGNLIAGPSMWSYFYCRWNK